MEIKVNEQTQRFYLAVDEWVPAVGHEIKVGKYRFSAIPLDESINISEVTSGVRAINVPMTVETWELTSTKEGTMKFLEKIGERLKQIIGKQINFDEHLEKQRKIAVERLGEMPPIEDVDTDWMFEEESETVH
ncbi:hypothetical protein OCE52_16870 [Bacillus mobilis]|uniref:hypothetical protein n=2 Tax=Bacteria TaxID=2 RepID=UPI0021CF5DB4|nr:hypothetical protein [Bacillus mobilis]MCU5196477.1 hypothetical protein [Bacillus mobilis]